MALPAPKLDDRSFQDLVDDAKRFIQERCPEWTDHNVSDPGVTLVETFAWMTDLLLFRLNRVPDRTFIKFLDLLGVNRYAPTAASVAVDFRLSAPQEEIIVVPTGTIVSTPRTINDAAIAFSVTHDLPIQSSTVDIVANRVGKQRTIRDITATLDMDRSIPCFSDEPLADDALYFGFDAALPDHIVVIEFDCEVAGHGVDPRRPPLRWEAWDGENWVACDVSVDETGGLNRSGIVELQLPSGHEIAEIDDIRRGWVRTRVIEDEEVEAYRSSPMIRSVRGFVMGATGQAVNAEFIDAEILGVSSGVAGQEFLLQNAPVVASDEPFVILTSQPDLPDEAEIDGNTTHVGHQIWELRSDFADSGPEDRHFTLDAHAGIVKFGPILRDPDGSARHHGSIPPRGVTVTASRYRTGGGAAGNVSGGAISVLRTSIPMIAEVTNRRPARGGVDAESVEQAKDRGPVQLRVRNRAVTIEDFEYLAREAAPELARVRALAVTDDGAAPGVRVLLVPEVGGPEEPLELRDLYPNESLRDKVLDYLDRRRIIGTRLLVEPPTYLGLRVAANVTPLPDSNPLEVEAAVKLALRQYFHPVLGGREGTGWEFGRDVRAGEVYSIVQRVRGVDVVQAVELFVVNPESGESEAAGDIIELFDTDLILPADHQITMVEE
jgi:predicted phage baseplate assembly protein